jgi:hypothetical protein
MYNNQNGANECCAQNFSPLGVVNNQVRIERIALGKLQPTYSANESLYPNVISPPTAAPKNQFATQMSGMSRWYANICGETLPRPARSRALTPSSEQAPTTGRLQKTKTGAPLTPVVEFTPATRLTPSKEKAPTASCL